MRPPATASCSSAQREINRFAITAKTSAEKILERARITQETLVDQIECVCAEFTKIKESAADD